ncbi:BTB/POZ domain protein [Ancylostoma duodenale]|uniref:BTB/POZ domain protein n=1 Tax=Ancylostoma duodenale TaxID=51022 RepID=A0A0C2FCP9_9BILA|nr:BTB/POZ domain protein [Ancylostoma duodenale]
MVFFFRELTIHHLATSRLLILIPSRFAAHRLILAKNSEVFDRMLSQRWNGEKKDLEMVEDAPCQKVFPAFLRFLYCNHVVLHQDNCLPILILADKYNVISLKKVCIDFAISEILPNLTLKDVFSIWFSYATKAYHQVLVVEVFDLMYLGIILSFELLIRACIQAIARDFELLITEEWEKSWLALDRDQMIEILKCNQLVMSIAFGKRSYDGCKRRIIQNAEALQPARFSPPYCPIYGGNL